MNSYNITVYRSNRRTICLYVNSDAEVIVRAPYFATKKKISEFISSHKEWIEKSVNKSIEHKKKYIDIPDAQKALLKLIAKTELPKRVELYSNLMNLKPAGIRITSAKKRLGSCSSSDSLCFSWRLMLYDDDVINYVVVHELAHIAYKNHSKDFYSLVSDYIPNYKELIKKIKNN